jgi:hypothetical protein
VQGALVHDPVPALADHILLGEPAGGLLQLTEREPVAPPEVRDLRHPRAAAGAPRRGAVPLAPAASRGRHAAAGRLPRRWPVLRRRRRRRRSLRLRLRHGLGELHRGLLLAADDLLDVLGWRVRGLLLQVLLEQLGVGGEAAAAAGEADEDEEEHEHDGGADGDADEHPEAEAEDGRRLRQPPVEVPGAPVRRRRVLPVATPRRRVCLQPPPRPHRSPPHLVEQRWGERPFRFGFFLPAAAAAVLLTYAMRLKKQENWRRTGGVGKKGAACVSRGARSIFCGKGCVGSLVAVAVISGPLFSAPFLCQVGPVTGMAHRQ